MAKVSSVSARARFKDAYRADRLCMSMLDQVLEAADPFFNAAPTSINLNYLTSAVGTSVRSSDPIIDRAVRIARCPLQRDPLLESRRIRSISTAIRNEMQGFLSI